MREYAGLVLGGPWDGRVLSWNSPHYRVAIGNMPMQALFERGKNPEENLKIDTFGYTHWRWPAADRSFWVPDPVMTGKMFDYHLYEHPLQYVIKKLVQGYNPGAK